MSRPKPGPAAPGPRARSWTSRLVLVALGTLIALGAVELGLRLYPWMYLRSRAQTLTMPDDGGALVYVMGDSIPAGYKVQVEEAWPAQLGALLGQRAGPRVEVYNAARPGASVVGIWQDQVSALHQITPGTPIVAILQIGHNDLFHLVKTGRAAESAWVDPVAIWNEMKLTRLLRSFEERQRRWRPPEQVSDTGRADFAHDLEQVCEHVRGFGGTCIFATYPVCGHVGPEAGVDRAAGYNRLRAAQVTTNQLIRWAGHATATPVLDFEYLVDLPPDWSLADCNDAVHPSAAVHRRMAVAVAETLFPD